MFRAIHKMRARDERGFTLVELLIVIAIIAILAAIAIPQFASYRVRGIKASMQADARNIATMEEATFGDTQNYSAQTGYTAGTPGPTSFSIGTQVGQLSSGNVLNITGSPTAYAITIFNAAANSASSGNASGYVQTNSGSATFY